jgi:hypothetical protein
MQSTFPPPVAAFQHIKVLILGPSCLCVGGQANAAKGPKTIARGTGATVWLLSGPIRSLATAFASRATTQMHLLQLSLQHRNVKIPAVPEATPRHPWNICTSREDRPLRKVRLHPANATHPSQTPACPLSTRISTPNPSVPPASPQHYYTSCCQLHSITRSASAAAVAQCSCLLQHTPTQQLLLLQLLLRLEVS